MSPLQAFLAAYPACATGRHDVVVVQAYESREVLGIFPAEPGDAAVAWCRANPTVDVRLDFGVCSTQGGHTAVVSLLHVTRVLARS